MDIKICSNGGPTAQLSRSRSGSHNPKWGSLKTLLRQPPTKTQPPWARRTNVWRGLPSHRTGPILL